MNSYSNCAFKVWILVLTESLRYIYGYVEQRISVLGAFIALFNLGFRKLLGWFL